MNKQLITGRCHPHFHPASPAAAEDVDLETAREILGPLALTNGIHMGTWSRPAKHEPHKVKEDLKYTKEDDEAIECVCISFALRKQSDDAASATGCATTSRRPGTAWARAR